MILFAALVAIFVGIYLLLGRNLITLIIGLVFLGNGVNLAIFFLSEPKPGGAAFVDTLSVMNDPVPQALVLTAIVISFALLTLLVAVARGMKHHFKTYDISSISQEET